MNDPLSDDFEFLLFDGETVGPGAGRLRNRLLLMIRSKETVLQYDNCKHADQIKTSTVNLLIRIVSKRPSSQY